MYKSFFYSPRNFANEGTYIYGSVSQIDKFEESVNWAEVGWYDEKKHRSEESAKKRCEKDARIDIRLTPKSDICSIAVAHISEFF